MTTRSHLLMLRDQLLSRWVEASPTERQALVLQWLSLKEALEALAEPSTGASDKGAKERI